MLYCLTLAIGIACSSVPRLTPAQAADVLRPNATQFYTCTDCDGPHVTIAPYTPPAPQVISGLSFTPPYAGPFYGPYFAPTYGVSPYIPAYYGRPHYRYQSVTQDHHHRTR